MLRRKGRHTPRWVWVLIICLSLIEPLTHLWIADLPPRGTVATGLRIPESVFHIHAMRMFDTGFANPFATCKSPHGVQYIGYYAIPWYWMYGILGAVRKWLQMDEFFALGLANGIGAGLYLFCGYHFLRESVPALANRAFVLFTLGGGLGGVLYLLTALLGWHSEPAFELYFNRHAMYELMEGPNLLPVLHMPRLHYTMSLALCLWGLTQFIWSLRQRSPRGLALSCLSLAVATVLNLHCGLSALLIAYLYLISQARQLRWARVRWASACTAAVAAASVGVFVCFSYHPTFLKSTLAPVREAMWLTPFISAAFFHVLLVPAELVRRTRELSRAERACAFAAIGYLAAFVLLFLPHQMYHGNLLSGREGTVAAHISDWALIGAAAGLVCFFFVPRREPCKGLGEGWIVLWPLLFIALALSGFGQGWFLRAVPQRLMMLLGLPLSILSASALGRMKEQCPKRAYGLQGAFIACGIASIAAASLCFQGPWIKEIGAAPYADRHRELMSATDAAVLRYIGRGTVLAPPFISDVISLRRNTRVVFGSGSVEADQPPFELERQVKTFFSTQASEEYRRQVLTEWRVDFVYCPDTPPVDREVFRQLLRMPCLKIAAGKGRAVLFRVAFAGALSE